MKIEGEALKKAVQEAEGKAHEYRSRANSSMTQEQLISLASSGMEELERARDLDRQALEKRTGVQQLRGNQNVTPGMRAAWSSEQTTLERTWTDRINAYGNAFNGLLTSSAQKTFSLTTKLREMQNKVHEMSDQAELRLYAAGAELRAKDSQLAQDKGTVSGRHVSTATTELHTREREPLELASLQRQLQEKVDFLAANQDLQAATGATLADQRSTAASSDATRKGILNGRDSKDITGPELLNYNAANSTYEAATTAIEKQDAAYHTLTKTIATTRVEIDNINNSIAGSTPGKRDGSDPKVIISDLTDAWKNYKTKVLDDTDVAKTMSEGFSGVANNFSGGLGQAFTSIVTGTKSVKNAFRDMATGVIKSMIDVLAQALAMQAAKGILSMFMTVGGATVGSYSTPEAAVAALPAANGGGNIVGLATGGYVRPNGSIERMRHMASGGSVYGGISNKDSVPTMLMPGEFVMNKPAVDAVGTDFLHGLNTTTNAVASASTNTNTVSPTNKDSKNGGTVNVYVVSPDQQPAMGPNDIIATVSNNIVTGGSVKQLIKSVQMGTV